MSPGGAETHRARSEPVWDLDRMAEALDAHRTGWLFVAGCVMNQGLLYERFDAVVLHSAPLDVLLTRVAGRANPFGSAAPERANIARDLTAFEPALRAGSGHEIVTTAPVAEVVATLQRIAALAAPGADATGAGSNGVGGPARPVVL